MRGHHVVHALGHGLVVALETLGVDHHVDVALVVLGRHVVHLGDQALQVAAHTLDGVVDESLLARQRRQRCVEIATAELGDHAHGQLLHANVGGHHVVNPLRHGAEVTLETLGVDGHVDVTALVLGRHVVHLGDQALQVATHLFDGVVDEGLLARQLRQRCVEVAAAELGDHAHGQLFHRNVCADHGVDLLRHLAQLAREALRVDDDVDVATLVLGAHAQHLLAQGLHGLQHAVQRIGRCAQRGRQTRRLGALREVATGSGLQHPREVVLDGFGEGSFFLLHRVACLDLNHVENSLGTLVCSTWREVKETAAV